MILLAVIWLLIGVGIISSWTRRKLDGLNHRPPPAHTSTPG